MTEDDQNIAESGEGQLAIDVYQDDHSIYLVAPIAGVKSSDISISITDEVITIRGERTPGHDIPTSKHFVQECYWGPFSRSYVVPVATDSDNAKAVLEDGLLRITIPKDEKVKTKFISIEERRNKKP
ncbi:MAG: Spore protein SP21 [bacterium ADurb.Bin212]|mgnify:CR=1 FL=1|nr:MAG: Spore protein SP21 [bacterium ADurb.Bin212]